MLLCPDSSTNRLAYTHEHDERGNAIGIGSTIGYANRVYRFNDDLYGYDDQGNVTLIRDIPSGDERTLTWDHRNQLVSVVHTAGITDEAHYHYDVLGRKVGEELTVGGTSEQTSYVYEGQSIVMEINAASEEITRSYFNGLLPNEVLAVDQHVPNEGTETVWLFADAVGSVRSMGHHETVLPVRTIAGRSLTATLMSSAASAPSAMSEASLL